MDAAAFEQVYGAFRDFHTYFAPLFGRRETRDRSRDYLQALLVQFGERRNAENLSESVGVSARAMQRFLTDSPWDDDTAIGRLQGYLAPRLGHPEAVGVLDGSDFPKQRVRHHNGRSGLRLVRGNAVGPWTNAEIALSRVMPSAASSVAFLNEATGSGMNVRRGAGGEGAEGAGRSKSVHRCCLIKIAPLH